MKKRGFEQLLWLSVYRISFLRTFINEVSIGDSLPIFCMFIEVLVLLAIDR